MPLEQKGDVLAAMALAEETARDSFQPTRSKVVVPKNPKLIRRPNQQTVQMKPSEYLREMSMTTEQKLSNQRTMSFPTKIELLDMAETTYQKISTLSIDEPIFQPFPSEVFFQNYEPLVMYEIPLVLRNSDIVPRMLKVSHNDTPYFRIVSPPNIGQKVGPGLPVNFKVIFTPDEKKDYVHELICITEREKFVIPIRAIGPRGLLDIPDEIIFPPSPVKYANSRTLLIRNIGTADAKFTISVEKPFSVTPDSGSIPVNESLQLSIDFHPLTVSEYNTQLLLHYSTGEEVYINVRAISQDALVRLEKSSLLLDNTYLSLSNQKTVTISNRSDVIVHFKWTRYATREEENQKKLMLMAGLANAESVEKDRFLQECSTDPAIIDKMSIISRSYLNKKRLIEQDEMLFSDEVIRLDPLEGDIWPNSTFDVNVIFSPDEAKQYNRTAFCDITGRESHLPLRITGEGIGPSMKLSFDSLDMGNIFVFSTHTYEVVLQNCGDIDAIYSILPTNSPYRSCFGFDPTEGIVMPDGYQAIHITFSSRILGDFSEDFYIQIDGAPSHLKLTFKGSVIAPTLSFDVPQLAFGKVSYGFESTKTCILTNTSLVPMTFYLRVPSDGIGQVLRCRDDQDGAVGEEARRTAQLKEFDIVPSTGLLGPQSQVEVKVTLCSNTKGRYDTALVVDVEAIAEALYTLPITAKCVIPAINVVNPLIDCGRCFLRHPYSLDVTLDNNTDLPAKYELRPCYTDSDDTATIISSCPQPTGILEAHTVTAIPLIIEAQTIDEIETDVFFNIVGRSDSSLVVQVQCVGVGPVVHFIPASIDWGQIQVLTEKPRIVQLCNESLIPAQFTARMVRANSMWRVEPSEGLIDPEATLDVVVTAYLEDNVAFTDKVLFEIKDSTSYTIPVSAIGHGTTIVSDPPMTSMLDLGPQFSKSQLTRQFLLSNRGRRHQSIVWSTEGFAARTVRRPTGLQRSVTGNSAKDIRNKDVPPPCEPPGPVFQISPMRMELNPGDSALLTLDAYVDRAELIQEKLLCHAIIGRSGGKELIKKVQVVCDFVNPLVEFSTNQIAFTVTKEPCDEFSIQTGHVQISNISSLPLDAHLSLKYPFSLLVESDNGFLHVFEQDITLMDSESCTIPVQFDPAYIDDCHSRTINSQLTINYKQHPHTDQIELRGCVFFPNLDFEKTTVDFGCILNDTEVTRYINISNNSPLEVRYHWSFPLTKQKVVAFGPLARSAGSAVERGQNDGGEIVGQLEGGQRFEEMDVVIEDQSGQQQGFERLRIFEKEFPEDGADDEEKKDIGKTSPTLVLDLEPLDDLGSPGRGGETTGRQSSTHRPESGMSSRQQQSTPPINTRLAAILDEDINKKVLPSVEEIFDILPIYGTLLPGESEQITLTFYGHSWVSAEATAICEVDGGPTYEIEFSGKASLVDYSFDYLNIDYNKIMYNEVAEAQITLFNSGHVGFDFTAVGLDPGLASNPRPGLPVLIPHLGHVEAMSEIVLTVRYLPAGPQPFHASFQIEVAHFAPDTVNLYGEGVFPRIYLNIPRGIESDSRYEKLVWCARESINTPRVMKNKITEQLSVKNREQEDNAHDVLNSINMYSQRKLKTGSCEDINMELEVERLVVLEFFNERFLLASEPDVLSEAELRKSVSDQSGRPSQISKTDSKKTEKLSMRPILPEYVLDFGHVVLGTTCARTVTATNTGWFPVSFSIDRSSQRALQQYGLHVELPKVVQLPGAPDYETVDFLVAFDPRGANLGQGPVEQVVPINLVNGPQIAIRVKAFVTIPDLQVSSDVVEFGDVKCGECCIVTVQLHNHQSVSCEWGFVPTSDKDKKQVDKHVPMHLRKRPRPEKLAPAIFEMIPARGLLQSGQRQNVQIKFMPNEQKLYEQRLVIRFTQSSQRLLVLCRGSGLEPHIEFDRPLVEFGPVLPHAAADEKEIIVRNPCKFPVEIYSLEFDKVYLEEEKVLRLMKGYDEYNMLLLPSRLPSEKLPQELLDYYEGEMRKMEEEEKGKREAEEAAAAEAAALREQEMNDRGEDKEGVQLAADSTTASSTVIKPSQAVAPAQPAALTKRSLDSTSRLTVDKLLAAELQSSQQEVTTVKSGMEPVNVGDLDVTPVSAAIARHLGIDLSQEGQAARNQRGIAIIVHGAPVSGKTATALSLARRYQAAMLTLDGVVQDAIIACRSQASRRAKELCAEAARHFREEQQKVVEGEEEEKKGLGGNLSFEAVTAHTQGTGLLGPGSFSIAHSNVSNRKASTVVSDTKNKGGVADKHHGGGGGGGKGGAAGGGTSDSSSQVIGPRSRLLSVSQSVMGEDGLRSTVLPDDILIDIVAERLQMPDCLHGVVFDGLESMFTQTLYSSAIVLLRSINNRKYIFSVTLKLDYNVVKEAAKQEQLRKEREAVERENAELARLADMSEDEYDALSEEDRKAVDAKRLVIKKERMKREAAERLIREKKEQEERALAEQKRLEEEKLMKRRNKKSGATGAAIAPKGQAGGAKLGEPPAPKHSKTSESRRPGADIPEHGRATVDLRQGEGGVEKSLERGDSNLEEKKRKLTVREGHSDQPQPHPPEKLKTSRKAKDADKDLDLEPAEPVKELTEAEQLLLERFQLYDHSAKEVSDLFDYWERASGTVNVPVTTEGTEGQDTASHSLAGGKRTRKITEARHGGKDKDKPSRDNKEALDDSGLDGQDPATVSASEEEKQEKRLLEGIGIPQISVNCNNTAECSPENKTPYQRAIDANKLPSTDDVLDGLGLGPKGPPIPGRATFAVAQYPAQRQAPTSAELVHYQFVVPSLDDTPGGPEDGRTDQDSEELKSMSDDHKESVNSKTTLGSKRGGAGSDKASKLLQQQQSELEKKEKRKRSAGGKRSVTRLTATNQRATPPTGGIVTPAVSDLEARTYRWIIPAESEITLKISFASVVAGRFDQTLNFEIVGTRRRYQLHCRGVATFPNISKEPRLVFPRRSKMTKTDEIIQKKYVIATDTFEFGPLLVGKSRDRYKEGRYPENMEKIQIVNTSPLPVDVSFAFLNDAKEETFLVEPKSMELKPTEQQELTLWAYPKSSATFEDSLVCCIKENPEPVMFKLKCYGVRPELELDKKVLHFDKVLLHRKDTKTLILRNPTLLPVAWKLNGLDNLGDDFSVSQDSGVVPPKSELSVHAYFKAVKPVTTAKKSIRLEVTDVDNYIVGLIQTETIQVHAEAYDVALDMSFPKGTEGGIDFDIIRVFDEAKQICTLKNKGKYEISYSFIFEPTAECPQSICDMFTITPHQRGTLSPTDRPVQMTVTFKSNREVVVKDQPILKCQVIEPSIGEGETIASIPVKLSVRSVFIKYNISPENDMNFGALLVNSKKTRSFTIENKTEKFDLKYAITKAIRPAVKSTTDAKLIKGLQMRTEDSGSIKSGTMIRKNHNSSNTAANAVDSAKTKQPEPKPENVDKQPKRMEPTTGSNQSRLILGMFTIYPAFGSVQPGNVQTVTVDCVAENQGASEEEISIDIIGRSPKDSPGSGVIYRLLAEACIPSINIDDIGSIFEEHRICRSLNVSALDSLRLLEQSGGSGGIYGEEERRFMFTSVLVGSKSKARFKIINVKKVPCDVIFTVKTSSSSSSSSKSSQKSDVFDVTPSRVQISAHSHVYAVITFSPQAMQQYNAMFEAAIETNPANQSKGRSLSFDLSGEGCLPHITVTKPAVRNKKGQPLVLFKKSLIGRIQTLPITITNDGTLTCKVDIKLTDPADVFTLKPTAGSSTSRGMDTTDYRAMKNQIQTSILEVSESVTFEVTFQAEQAQRFQGEVRLSVVNNQYEDLSIQLVGEGYQDTITLDIHHSVHSYSEAEEGNLAGDDVAAAKSNLMRFGDCAINEARTITMSMTNHHEAQVIRFAWPDHLQLKFSPQLGHLMPGSSKDIAVTFKTDKPINLQAYDVKCKVTKIILDQPVSAGNEWDDRLKTVKWVDVSRTSPPSSDGGAPTHPPSTAASQSHGKRKVVETEPEPMYREVPEFSQTVSLLVTANADYAKYKITDTNLHFRDTLMFQTRIYNLTLTNHGSVSLDYNWLVVMEDLRLRTTPRYSPSLGISADPIADPPLRPMTAGSLLIRAEEELRPSSSCTNIDYVPFVIDPVSGTVAPGKSAQVTVKFCPFDANEYEGRLICSIPNLEPNAHGPAIGLKGRSLMPYCHFDLEDSDYIRSARRNPELPGPFGAPAGLNLDAKTRVLEIDSLGVGQKCSKTFTIINPTNQNYSYQWTNEDGPGARGAVEIGCTVLRGSILSGKTAQITFEYAPSSLDLVESFWRFDIPEQNITIPFLLVGRSKEPNLVFDRSHINFRTVMIGHETRESLTMINSEDEPFNFNFDKTSCHSAGFTAKLSVEPMSGTIAPKSSLPIALNFTANAENEVNFNVVCNIKRKQTPLTVNVKAEGYRMNCVVFCEDGSSNKYELSSDSRNIIDFGRVEVHESAVRNLNIVNLGKFGFNYSWIVKDHPSVTSSLISLGGGAGRDELVTVAPQGGLVEAGDKVTCLVTFCAPKTVNLKNHELLLQIAHGPTYNLQVCGSSVMPGVHFSFSSYNFGPCFVYRTGVPPQTALLKLTNNDSKDISVTCLYSSSSWLKHSFEAGIIAPHETVEVTFTFCPLEPIKYKDTVTFEINGLSKQSVDISGQGADMKIEVADVRQKTLKFGALKIGQTLKKTVPIVNNSPIPMTFRVTLTPVCPGLQESGVLYLTPAEPITLQPKGGIAKVDVVLNAKSRIANFSEEVHLEYAGLHQTLFLVTGCCQGIEITLDTDSIPFGAVVQKSSSSRQLIMTNSGDIGARFKWDSSKLAPNFSITPLEGYISAGMEVPMDVVFQPHDITSDIRCQNIKCTIEGMKPLYLTLTGACINVPPMKDLCNFTTIVRQKETKNLQIANHSNQTWNLRPIIEGEFWTGPETIQVAPQTTKSYELTYQPLMMTPDGKKHAGNIFFALPDGTGLMYNLSGTAEPPKPSCKILREVPCKTTYTELLPVQNWLKKSQRFRVKIESVKPDRIDPGTTIKGLDYIDVQGLATKDYKLTFHAHKESQPQIKVIFTNEQSGEYQFYEITFRAVRPGVMSSVQLSTPVRQRKQHTLTLENPLNTPVTFTATSNLTELQLPSQISVPALSEGQYSFEYFPLKVATTQGRLEFNCADLGLYMFDLELRATPAGPERPLHFNTSLGSMQTLTARFINYAKHKTDYFCKLDHADFHVDKTVGAAPASSSGTEVVFEVQYEPSAVGESHTTLTLTSNVGGDYTFPLFGVCVPPKPQGPFVVKSGSSVSIPFKNVFAQTAAFSFQVDNPLFHVNKSTENIKSRKEHKIVISFDSTDPSKSPVMGRLTVACPQSTVGGGASNNVWVYYLKGVTM